jgi:hypothetical protein
MQTGYTRERIARSERDIVVGSWSTAATAASAAAVSTHIGIRWLFVRTAAGPTTTTATATTRRTISAAAAAEELHIIGDDLGDVAFVAVFVVVVSGLDPTFDIDLAPFGQVLGTDLCSLSPDHDAVPFRPILTLSILVVPALAGGQAQFADSLSTGGVTHIGIGTEMSYENNFVDSTSHGVLTCSRARATTNV